MDLENCFYDRKLVCAYDLKDEDGLYYEERVLEWKEAAAERKLFCTECKKPVYLAAGPVKEPYFAHYDLEECDYGRGQESEELKKGKRLLYHLAKRSFPEGDILVRHRLDNGMYCTIFCSGTEYSIALDYRLVNNSLEKFRLRNDYYLTHNIQPVYFLGERQEKDTRQLDWYQNLLQNSMGYLAFLDAANEVLTLKKCYGYRLGKKRHFKHLCRAYPVKELKLDTCGRMICDFEEKCRKLERQIEEEKQRYQRQSDQLRQLLEERQVLERREQERMKAYAGLQSQKEQSDDTARYEPEKQEMKTLGRLNREEVLGLGLNPDIYERCVAMIEQGEGHLVGKKYFDIIMKA